MAQAKRFFIHCLTIILIILSLEVSLRVFAADLTCKSINPILKVCGEYLKAEFDKDRFWRLDNEVPEDFINADFKIIVLSDSVSVMLEGSGYPEILEDFLLKKTQKNIKVFNAGVPGYTSYQGLLYFREMLFTQPDLVIVNFGWNDHWCSINGLEDKNQKFSRLFYIKRTICSISKIFSLLDNLYFKINEKQYKIKLENLDLSVCKKRVSLEDYIENLREIIKICKERKVKVILMTAVYLDNESDWLDMHLKYNSAVRDIAKEENICLLDAVNLFKKSEALFLEPDVDQCHINLKGSRILAQRLASIIETILINN